MNRHRFLNALAGALSSALWLDNRAAWAAAWSARRWTAVQRLLDGYVANKKIAGAAAALSYGGSPPAYPSAGYIALNSPVRFDENSLCRIYSMTKPRRLVLLFVPFLGISSRRASIHSHHLDAPEGQEWIASAPNLIGLR